MENPFKLISDQLLRIEERLEKIESKLDKIEGGGINTSEPATKNDAARYLGVSLSTINALLKSKQLTPVRIGTSVRFTYEDLDAFIEKKKS